MTFNQDNFISLCDHLAQHDPDLKQIILDFGYPPMWYRKPSFETLIHFILEQQVSLASAKATLEKLRMLVGQITPANILLLSDGQLRACYFSRQKNSYARSLTTAITHQTLNLDELVLMDEETIRHELKKVKGIGDWTVDVFLLISLQHADIFPLGDIALLNSTRHVKKLDPAAGKPAIAVIAQHWKPYRSIATYLLWHAYLKRKEKGKSKKKCLVLIVVYILSRHSISGFVYHGTFFSEHCYTCPAELLGNLQ